MPRRDERAAYLKQSRRACAATADTEDGRSPRETARPNGATRRAAPMPRNATSSVSAAEQFVLTDLRERLRQAHLVLRIPDHGPRRQGHRRHGGQRAQRARLVASFPVEESDQIMLVTTAAR